MPLVHTIADNETPAERRTVVELADAISARTGHYDAAHLYRFRTRFFGGRANRARRGPWNELGALRQTLEAHAEAHMQRLAERVRRSSEKSVTSHTAPGVSSRPNLRGALDRLLGRG